MYSQRYGTIAVGITSSKWLPGPLLDQYRFGPVSPLSLFSPAHCHMVRIKLRVMFRHCVRLYHQSINDMLTEGGRYANYWKLVQQQSFGF